jgi:hypothetical protein
VEPPLGQYEIARSILKGNGLMTVFIHGAQNQAKEVTEKGANPLAQIGLYKVDDGIFFAEWSGGKWAKYADYTLAIAESDLWFAAPTSNNVDQLSNHRMSYDFTAQNGRENIGGWIETAAGLAGR